MSEIISFETEEMKKERLLREADALNKKTMARAKRKLNNPNASPLEKAKARLVIASLSHDYEEFKKQSPIMDRLMEYKLEVA